MNILCKLGLHRWKENWRADTNGLLRQQHVIPVPNGFNFTRAGWPGAWGEFVPDRLCCTRCGKVRKP